VTRRDTKGRSLKFKESWRALFKWINSLEQYNNKGKCHKKDPVTVQVNYNSLEQCKHKEKMHAKGEEKQTWRRRSCSNVESVMVARSVFVCFNPLPSVLYLRLFFAFSFLCVFVTFSTGSCTFFSLVLSCVFCLSFSVFLPALSFSFLSCFPSFFSVPFLGH
jgi:hypothetical protein